MTRRRILLIEDDPDLGASLSENLQLEGYYVDWSKSGDAGLKIATENLHDLILLDLMLPNIDGFSVLKKLRQNHNTPVMILSARSQIEDKIKGLELQADDYLTKPFHLKELFLRIKNLLARQQANKTSGKIQIANTEIDFDQLIMKNASTQESISETEAKALLYFYNNRNKYLSRDQIMNHIWGFSKNPNTRSVDNIILKFRKIIEPQPAQPIYFISKRGLGYCLQLEKDEP